MRKKKWVNFTENMWIFYLFISVVLYFLDYFFRKGILDYFLTIVRDKAKRGLAIMKTSLQQSH